ncbi:hypothetical protein BKA69DRAFT_77402 [Paraphysoderma sedebokerense]|nr:hypothetical protein BKA69DRAFT_77402 [Paraphysoderma sedebokerense]
MSYRLNRYLRDPGPHYPHQVELPKSDASAVKQQMESAIERLRVAVSDKYDAVGVFSFYWESDNTGAKKDSELFVNTLSTIQDGVVAHSYSTPDESSSMEIITKLCPVLQSLCGKRKLFILHYAGHAIEGCTSANLVLTPKAGQARDIGPEIEFSTIKDALKYKAKHGLDVLFIMDCCCASIEGRDWVITGGRAEFVAATAGNGIRNSRQDETTLTQQWCCAFDKLKATGKPFTCDEVIQSITNDTNLQQSSRLFILREGWDMSITFNAHERTSVVPSCVTARLVMTVLNLREDPNDNAIKEFIDYLETAPVPIQVIVAHPTRGTLLILLMPSILSNLLLTPSNEILVSME